MRLFPFILIAFLSVVWWNQVYAQDGEGLQLTPVILADDQDNYPLGLYLEILEDPSGALTIEEVSSPDFDERFALSQVEVPNFGFTDSAYWVRFTVRNETSSSDHWLLEAGRQNMQFVDMYNQLPGQQAYEVRQTGSLIAPANRDVRSPRMILNLEVPTNNQQSVYLRFQSGAAMALPLTLWAQDAFWSQSQLDQVLHGLYFGTLLALLAYNLFLCFSLRELNYFYLVLLLASLIVFESGYTGYADIYISPSLYQLKQQFQGLSLSLLFISMILFTDSFLELKFRFPLFHWLAIVIVSVWIALFIISQLASYRMGANLLVAWILPTLLVILIAGTISWSRDNPFARFFMIAWFGMLAALFFQILTRLGVLPGTFVGDGLYRAGIVWMAVFWSIALADRINRLKGDIEDSEHRLSQILEGLPIGVVVYGKDYLPNYINRRVIEILSNPSKGIEPDLAAGRTLAQAMDYYSIKEIGSGQDYPMKKMPIARALQGEPSSIDDAVVDLIDRQVPLEIWASPVKDDTGNVEAAVVAFQDITRRKRIDAELAEYREHLERLVKERTTELRAVEQLLRTQIEWLSIFKEVSQTIVGPGELPQAYKTLSECILSLLNAQTVNILYGTGEEQLQALCCWQDGEPYCDLKRLQPPFQMELPLEDEIEKGDLVTVPAAEISQLPAPLSECFRDLDADLVILAPLIIRDGSVGLLGIAMTKPNEDIKTDQFELIKKMAFDLGSLAEDAHLLEQSRNLVAVKERNRLARELHDSVTQTLFTASVIAEAIPLMWDKDPQVARYDSERISLILRGALAEMRSLLLELRSDERYNQSLGQLLTTLAEIGQSRSRSKIAVVAADDVELPRAVNMAFYRIAREALNNVINHARATQIEISLFQDRDQVELHIEDNGIGFDPQKVPDGHLGIAIMTERAIQIGGDLQIKSAPGKGTAVIVTWWSSNEN
ncbi:MAG: 7TM-DISM domain-containing protein [Candidatus Promineifilaceae bacterium]|nr:7TM-DISM domain-containing protein [Candidatus Promineifilaceae bacterium]